MEHPTYKASVRNLQKYLRALSVGDDREIFAVPIDGIYEDATENAVIEFQRRNTLPITGRADKATYDAIYLEYLRLTEEDRRRYSPDLFPALPDGYATDFGERGPFIAALEFILDELRIAYDTLPTFERDGTYDGDTALAVKEFQRIHGLPITGRVDRRTWSELSRAYDSYARYSR